MRRHNGMLCRSAVELALWVGFLCSFTQAYAWVLNIAAAPRRVFLQVGNGAVNVNTALVNLVSLAQPIAANQVGNGVAQALTSDSSQSASPYDGYSVCNPPLDVYVGGFYQSNTASDPGSARLQVSSPAVLLSPLGDSIPFSQISWSSSANGNSTADIAAGTFNGSTLLLSTVGKNTWVENCLKFKYANAAIVAAGTYTGRVTFTLTAP